MTIKDKFPILVVEELMNELNGAMTFSKLDIRSGDNQIHVEQENVPKIAFQIHEGQYEFLVCPLK